MDNLKIVNYNENKILVTNFMSVIWMMADLQQLVYFYDHDGVRFFINTKESYICINMANILCLILCKVIIYVNVVKLLKMWFTPIYILIVIIISFIFI